MAAVGGRVQDGRVRLVPGLYAIVDVDATSNAGLDVLEFAARVIAARPAAVQLRAKYAPAGRVLELLLGMAERAAPLGVPVFANDRPDLAWLAGCQGVHVGQQDLPLEAVRRIAPQLGVGISTHDLEQLEAALAQRPEYVAFGPIFSTTSKRAPDAVTGLAALRTASDRAREHRVPLVAIGGIRSEHAAQIRESASNAAVIAALLPMEGQLESVTDRAAALHRLLGGS